MSITIREFGNQLLLNDNGVKKLAYPTQGGLWIVTGEGGGGPDPEPGTGFTPPFGMAWGADVSYQGGEYGPRTGGAGTFHEGIDFGYGAAQAGAEIHVAGAGVVESNYFHANFGNLLIVHHGPVEGYENNDVKTLYAHMQNPSPLQVGSQVAKGAVAGTVGNTGASYGAHLHHEVHVCAIGGNIIWNTSNNGNPRTAIDPRIFYGAPL